MNIWLHITSKARVLRRRAQSTAVWRLVAFASLFVACGIAVLSMSKVPASKSRRYAQYLGTAHDRLRTLGNNSQNGAIHCVDLRYTQCDLDDAKWIVKRLPHARCIDLRFSSAKDSFIREVATLSDVNTMLLSHTHISDDSLIILGHMRQLRRLHISSGPYTGGVRRGGVTWAGLHSLQSLTQLTELHISGVYCTNGCLWFLSNFGCLQQLDLEACQNIDSEMQYVGSVNTLRELSLEHTDVSDDALSEIRGLTSLRTLNLNETKVTGAGLRHLMMLRELESLSIEGLSAVSNSVSGLSSLEKLKTLKMGRTHITNSAVVALGHLRNVEVLWINATNVGDEAVDTLAKMENIRELNVAGSKISENGVQRLKEVLGANVSVYSGIVDVFKSHAKEQF